MTDSQKPPSINTVQKRFRRRRKRQDGEPSAIDLIEEGVHLLRQTPIRAWAVYFSGMVPFVLGFLFFWTEMASSGLAGQVLVPGAFGLALLFFWLKLTQACFAKGLRETLNDQEERSWTLKQWLKVLRRQLFWQSSGLIVLPIAFVLTIPFAWVSAFYQNVLIADPAEDKTEDEWIKENWRLGRIWHEQNWILLSLLCGVFFLSFINILSVVGLIPYLLKTLLGIETVFSRAGMYLFNTTTLFTCLLLSYVVTDPLLKAVYVLRRHYCASRQTGADMLLRLRRVISGNGLSKLVVILFLLGLSPIVQSSSTGLFGQDQEAEVSVVEVDVDNLDTSIEEVLQRREFVWRFPREEIESNTEEPEWLKSLSETLKAWQEKFEHWIESWFKSDKDSKTDKNRGDGWDGFAGLGSFLSYLLIAIFVLLVIYFGVRAWKMYQ